MDSHCEMLLAKVILNSFWKLGSSQNAFNFKNTNDSHCEIAFSGGGGDSIQAMCAERNFAVLKRVALISGIMRDWILATAVVLSIFDTNAQARMVECQSHLD